MNHETSASLAVLLLAAIGVAMLIMIVPAPIGVFLSKKGPSPLAAPAHLWVLVGPLLVERWSAARHKDRARVQRAQEDSHRSDIPAS